MILPVINSVFPILAVLLFTLQNYLSTALSTKETIASVVGKRTDGGVLSRKEFLEFFIFGTVSSAYQVEVMTLKGPLAKHL